MLICIHIHISLLTRIDVVMSLTDKQFQLHLLSNSDDRILNVLNDLKLLYNFKSINLSYNLNYEKPDINLFKAAINNNNLNEFKNYYVGDDINNDYYSIMNYKNLISPILFHNDLYHKPINSIDLNRVNFISNLNDLMSKLI